MVITKKIIPIGIIMTLLFAMLSSTAYAVGAATLSLSPTAQTIAIGDEVAIAVTLDTDGIKTSDTDLYIQFDTTKLVLTDIVPGTLYDQYIGKDINNGTGEGAIIGIASTTDKLFNGVDIFVTLHFKAIEAGTSAITIKFTPGERNDSNVVNFETSEDILTAVTNAALTIQAATAATPTMTPVPTINQNTSDIPVTASALPTLLISLSSFGLFGLGAYIRNRF